MNDYLECYNKLTELQVIGIDNINKAILKMEEMINITEVDEEKNTLLQTIDRAEARKEQIYRICDRIKSNLEAFELICGFNEIHKFRNEEVVETEVVN